MKIDCIDWIDEGKLIRSIWKPERSVQYGYDLIRSKCSFSLKDAYLKWSETCGSEWNKDTNRMYEPTFRDWLVEMGFIEIVEIESIFFGGRGNMNPFNQNSFVSRYEI